MSIKPIITRGNEIIILCALCGMPLERAYRFCPFCGSPIDWDKYLEECKSEENKKEKEQWLNTNKGKRT